MERIISYGELPRSHGQPVYLRMETDPKLYLELISKGYWVVNNIRNANNYTIYITGRRQDYGSKDFAEYKRIIDNGIQEELKARGVVKPKTVSFSFNDLFNYKYQLPFVLKNENQNGGREKFLIRTLEDYDNLIKACKYLIEKTYLSLVGTSKDSLQFHIDYYKYLSLNFTVQEYIKTPSEYNTTVRLLTSSSNDLLYGALKYNESVPYVDDTTLLGYLLSEVYPLSSNSIVSNTLSGGKNVLLGNDNYEEFENSLLHSHRINSREFSDLVDISKEVHEMYRSELGIICGFDYIYDADKEKWFLLEYHSRPMVGDYSKRQGLYYQTKEDRLEAEGRVRATALGLTLRKTR